ncbi:MAG TPA: serine/threonine-protein kinase [Candidatus Nanopelagicales bacterium]|nr:serine/threonine-protein kinase [Candidatus Nanopelagicales bacterium]
MTDAHQQQRYRVIERLASGGMAEVFLAESAGIEGFKKLCAIKRVLPQLSEKRRFIAMFLDEARLSASLSHSNVAQVFDIGVGDNAYFIVMEYVDGADLKAVIEWMRKTGKPIPLEAAVYIAAKICEGLTYAHELRSPEGKPLKIVHRDMSPPNVLLTKYGEVKIVDFGLAKATSQLEKSEAGIVKGKFSYLSPEAAEGIEVDHRADIFAVGIILWEMLTGERLFFGESDFQTVKLVQNAEVRPASSLNKAVKPALDGIIGRALARDREQRYGSAREMGRELWDFLYNHGKSVSAFDIAELVRGAMSLRKRAPATTQSSLIDRLIEETLLEFTSLQSDAEPPLSSATQDPAKLPGFYDISGWAEEVNAPAPEQEAVQRAISAVEPGNLAALEEEPEKDAEPKKAAEPVLAAPEKTEVAAPAPAASGGGAVKAMLLVAVLAIIAAGAYFGGLIPR